MQSGKPRGDEDISPEARDSALGISRRLPQNAFEVVPADCGCRQHSSHSYLRAKGISPWSGQSSGRADTKLTWRKRLLRRAAQRDTALRQRVETSEQTQCKWIKWRPMRASLFAKRCREPLHPCPSLVLHRDFD